MKAFQERVYYFACKMWLCEKNPIICSNTRMLKNKIFKQEIGIAEKSQETRRDCCGGNVNHKFLF